MWFWEVWLQAGDSPPKRNVRVNVESKHTTFGTECRHTTLRTENTTMTTTRTCVRDCLRDTDGKVDAILYVRTDTRSRSTDCRGYRLLTTALGRYVVHATQTAAAVASSPSVVRAESKAARYSLRWQLHYQMLPNSSTGCTRRLLDSPNFQLSKCHSRSLPFTQSLSSKFVDNTLDNNRASCRCPTNHLTSVMSLIFIYSINFDPRFC